MDRREYGIMGIIALAVFVSRILPHAPNFTATVAGLIFVGSTLRKSIYAFSLIFCYYLADLIINNISYSVDHLGFQWTSQSFYWIYTSLFLVFFLSRMTTENLESPFRIFGLSVLSSVLFYSLTNFGVWMENILYLKNFSGLISCYIAGLPFLLNEFAANIFYCCLFFGAYWVYESRSHNIQSNLVEV